MSASTIKRTTTRRYPLVLSAAAADAGPYYLTDLAGVGVTWRNIASVEFEVDVTGPTRVTARRSTWVPVYERARLAFELCELDATVTAQEAKRAADKACSDLRLTHNATHAQRVAYAFSWLATWRSAKAVA